MSSCVRAQVPSCGTGRIHPIARRPAIQSAPANDANHPLRFKSHKRATHCTGVDSSTASDVGLPGAGSARPDLCVSEKDQPDFRFGPGERGQPVVCESVQDRKAFALPGPAICFAG